MDGYWVYRERSVDAETCWKVFGHVDQRRLEETYRDLAPEELDCVTSHNTEPFFVIVLFPRGLLYCFLAGAELGKTAARYFYAGLSGTPWICLETTC